MLIHLVAGARPNFMKVAPLWHAFAQLAWANPILVHTGQHYDEAMSGVFLRQFGLPVPHHALEVGSGTHAVQTAGVMIAYEKLCAGKPPDLTIVVGDVNSTMACALVAAKLGVPVAHLEAGLRSRDRSMPEEINRVVTDAVSDLLWTPSADADENLLAEGVPADRIERVGNIMIDCFELNRSAIAAAKTAEALGHRSKSFGLVTLHRPSNVDDPIQLGALVNALIDVAAQIPLIVPLHPRTKERLSRFGLLRSAAARLSLIEPLDYVSFMSLVAESRLVITDSGGVQEETTYLDIPCLTLRKNTERPVTITEGSNELVETSTLAVAVNRVLTNTWKRARRPAGWDGQAAKRVVASIERWRASRQGPMR